MTQNEQLSDLLTATGARPRPGAFALGSPQSRAAARALFSTKLRNAKRLDFVVSVVGCPEKYNPPKVGKWREGVDGSMSRISYIPWGMTIEQAERIEHDRK